MWRQNDWRHTENLKKPHILCPMWIICRAVPIFIKKLLQALVLDECRSFWDPVGTKEPQTSNQPWIKTGRGVECYLVTVFFFFSKCRLLVGFYLSKLHFAKYSKYMLPSLKLKTFKDFYKYWCCTGFDFCDANTELQSVITIYFWIVTLTFSFFPPKHSYFDCFQSQVAGFRFSTGFNQELDMLLNNPDLIEDTLMHIDQTETLFLEVTILLTARVCTCVLVLTGSLLAYFSVLFQYEQ